MEATEFEQNRREAEDLAESKTAKNRAKRQKKKNRSRAKGPTNEDGTAGSDKAGTSLPIKKRRLVSGKKLIFKAPGDDNDGEDNASEGSDIPDTEAMGNNNTVEAERLPGDDSAKVAGASTIVIHEDD